MAARDRRAIDLLAQRPVRQRRERRLAGRVDQRDHPLACLLVCRRRGRRRRDIGVRHPGEVLDVVDDHGAGVHLLQLVLLVRRLELGDFLVEPAQRRLIGGAELRARPHEVEVVTLEQTLVDGIELQLLARLIQRVDPREQLRIEMHVVVVLRQQGRDVGLDLVHHRICHHLRHVAEHVVDATEHHAGALHRDDRVVERRRGGLIRDRAELAIVDAHRFHERGHVVGLANLIERHRVLVERARDEQWIRVRRRWRRGCGCRCRCRCRCYRGFGDGRRLHRRRRRSRAAARGGEQKARDRDPLMGHRRTLSLDQSHGGFGEARRRPAPEMTPRARAL